MLGCAFLSLMLLRQTFQSGESLRHFRAHFSVIRSDRFEQRFPCRELGLDSLPRFLRWFVAAANARSTCQPHNVNSVEPVSNQVSFFLRQAFRVYFDSDDALRGVYASAECLSLINFKTKVSSVVPFVC